LDTLDIKILRELGGSGPSGFLFDPRIPVRRIATKLGVNKDTVGRRMKRFRDIGLIQGWMAFANPSLFGVKETRLRFDIPARSSKDDLVRKLRLIPGVTIIASLYGDSIMVGLFSDSEHSLKKSTELISRISNTEDILRFDNIFPECRMRLSETDWEIIRSLQENPRKPYHLVSKELGLSSRTVKRRLERLIEGKAISAVTAVDLSVIDGTVVSLLVFYTSPERRGEANKRVLSYLDDCILRAELGNKDHGFFNLIISNVARIQEISRWMRDEPGVSSYRIDLVQEFIQLPEALSGLLEKRPVKMRLRA
jgi:DNA-binding Lrp family transcriptional regulator